MRLLYLPSKFSQQRQTEKKVWVYPVLMAMEAEYMRRQGHIVYWGEDPRGHDCDYVITELQDIDFLDLPAPDRIFSDAFNPKYQRYGNYKYHPATHMMVARDCWWHQCTFCSWAKKYPEYQVRDIGKVTDEIIDCVKLGFKEIFDDSGTFPTGKFLDTFCALWKDNKAVKFGCNMRICNIDYEAMARAGFRMVLFGVESANQKTLDRLQKGVNANEIIPTLTRASKAGLEPHVAVMFGYPWETDEDEQNTLRLVHHLLKKGIAKTAQASVYRVQGQEVIDRGLTGKIYEVAKSPEFWYWQLKDLRTFDDFKYLLRKVRAGLWR